MSEIIPEKNSWLQRARLLEYKGVLFWDTEDYPDVPYSDSDLFITLDSSNVDRIDQIAYEQYGDAELWWVILLANNVELPNHFVQGQRIRIPAKDTIDQLLIPTET